MHKSEVEGFVSRETMEKLEHYVDLLLKWNKKINLIGKQEENNIWERHIIECFHLAMLLKENSANRILVDFGSGAGLPGIVIAAICPNMEIHLIESNSKKASFLQIASLKSKNITIHNKRIEKIYNLKADYITARAFADIDTTISYAKFHKCEKTKIFTFKGERLAKEVNDAKINHDFDWRICLQEEHTSKCLIEISNI